MYKYKKKLAIVVLILTVLFYITSIGFMIHTSHYDCDLSLCDICTVNATLTVLMTDVIVGGLFLIIPIVCSFVVEVKVNFIDCFCIYRRINLILLKVRLDC